MTRLRAMVIGGSLSGLFTANLLRISGWHVEVFERARGDLSGRGAGLGAQSELFSVMRRVGIPMRNRSGRRCTLISVSTVPARCYARFRCVKRPPPGTGSIAPCGMPSRRSSTAEA